MSEKETLTLKSLFQISETDDGTNFKEVLNKVVTAAFKEYKEMFLGMGLPTRADEIMQNRLFLLIEYYFKRIPTESEVSAMFQLNQSRSKSLIRSVMTKNHYKLEEKIKNTLKNLIKGEHEKIEENGKNLVLLNIESNIMVEELNLTIGMRAREDSTLDRIRKYQNSAITYKISLYTYRNLCNKFNLEITESQNDNGQNIIIAN